MKKLLLIGLLALGFATILPITTVVAQVATCKVTTGAPTYSTGTSNACSLTTSGFLRTTGTAGIDQSTPGTTNGVVVNSGTVTTLTTLTGGGIASGAADSGNPVKVGGKYNSTKPTFADGQRGDLQIGSKGALAVQLMIADNGGSISAGSAYLTADGTVSASQQSLASASFNQAFNGTTWDRVRNTGVSGGALLTELGPYSYSRKTADGQVKGSAGFVHSICVEPTTATPTAGLIAIDDALTETTPIAWSKWVFAAGNGGCEILDAVFTTGIFVSYDATATNISVTVTYR